MKYLFCVLIVCYSLYSFSQLKGNIYQFPERFNKNYFFDPFLSYQKIKDVQVKGFTEDQMEYYKIMKTFNVQRDFDNNSYYLEWYDLENYLYKIIDTILPIEIKKQQPYDVFIERDVNYNASALGNGFVFANIGLIANCKSEAELAYVLAHEIGHSIFNHGYMINSEFVSAYNNRDYGSLEVFYNKMFEKSQYAELQSDSFAYKCIEKVNYDLHQIIPSLDLMGYSEFKSQFYINKSQRGSYKEYMKKFSTHPSFHKRKLQLMKEIQSNKNHSKSNIIDSTYFLKVKKIAHEECKKISFETGDFENSMKLSFIDFLAGDNGLKNIFMLFESIRRYIYSNPDVVKKGFLAEDLQFTEFENTNYSILKKPEILFSDSLEYLKLSKHKLIQNDVKPFNTYEEAYFYFVNLAEEKGFNESIFSQALYYYFKKDNVNFNIKLNQYIEKGGGLYTDFANNLKQYGYPYILNGKINILIDNSSNFSIYDNYFHSIQRISYNKSIKDVFVKDSLKIELTMMNELLGISPRKLYEYQKLKWNISQIYSEADEEIFYKKRYLSREIMEDREKRNKFNKNLMIFAPEWYKWFIENKFNGIVYQKIKYEYKSVKAPEEYHNYYLMGYYNFIDNRPFYAKCVRNGSIRKQSHDEMAKDIREYLFYKE